MVKKRRSDVLFAINLLAIAEADLEAAEVLMESKRKVRPEIICYQAEQSIEKAMKAVISAKAQFVPLSHDLGLIQGLLENIEPFPFECDFGELSQYATIRRYEGGHMILEQEDINATIDLARKIVNWAKKALEPR